MALARELSGTMAGREEDREHGREEVSVRVGVLGPLEVRDGAGNLVPVGGARLRSLLIRLAVGDGQPGVGRAAGR